MTLSITSQQYDAIHTLGRPLLVEAGAGTGKTWVLVERFVHLLATHPHWPLDGLVAITFTEKAAYEMRQRIRQRIERLAADPPPESQAPWQKHLRALDTLQVGTIHAFCAKLLRENALSLGLDPAFRVMDEQEALLCKDEALHEALRLLVHQKGHLLEEMLSQMRVFAIQRQMATLLEQRGSLRRLFFELDQAPDEEILARWREGVSNMQDDLWRRFLKENQAWDDALAFFAALDPQSFKPDDKMTPWAALAHQAALAAQDGASATTILPLLAKIGDMRGGSAKAWASKQQLEQLKEHLKYLRETAQELIKKGFLPAPPEEDQQALSQLRRYSALWKILEERYQLRKAHENALDFDDLEIEAERLLSLQPRPQRLHDALHHLRYLMVDEFQDTNQNQQSIVYALAAAAQKETPSPSVTSTTSAASVNTRLSADAPLFVVGDAKQSIYRFRQAQVSVFQQTAADIEAITGAPALPLRRSFRTQRQLVLAVNQIFDALLTPQGQEYALFEARPSPLEAARELPHDHPASLAPIEIAILPDHHDESRLSSEESRIQEARWIVKRIQSLLEEGFLIWDRKNDALRPLHYSDIAILFRATTQIALYEEALKQASLPYLTASGRGYFAREEIQDILSLLAVLENPSDDLALAALLRSPFFHLSDETLYRLRLHDPADGRLLKRPMRSLREALDHPPPTDQENEIARASEILQRLSQLVGRASIWQILREAFDATGYEAALALYEKRLGAGGREAANLRKLMRFAREDGSANLGAFWRKIRALQSMEAREGEAILEDHREEAIQLMSIHAAKGLEFPVVFVADLGRRNAFGAMESILHDPAFGIVCKSATPPPPSYQWGAWLSQRMEEAEAKRLFYVACTRAADLLIFSGKTGTSTTWMRHLLDLYNIHPNESSPDSAPNADSPQKSESSTEIPKSPESPAHSESPKSPAPDAFDPLASTLHHAGASTIRLYRPTAMLARPLPSPALLSTRQEAPPQPFTPSTLTEIPPLAQPLPSPAPQRYLASPAFLDTLRLLDLAQPESPTASAWQGIDGILRLCADDPLESLVDTDPLLWLSLLPNAPTPQREAFDRLWEMRLLRALLALPRPWEQTPEARAALWTHRIAAWSLSPAQYDPQTLAAMQPQPERLLPRAEDLWTRIWQPFLLQHLSHAKHTYFAHPFSLPQPDHTFASGRLDLLWQDPQDRWHLWAWSFLPPDPALLPRYQETLALQARAVQDALSLNPHTALLSNDHSTLIQTSI
jgi:ATP-dependent helicase/nuclease subunit A